MKKLEETLNMKSLEEILAETEADDDAIGGAISLPDAPENGSLITTKQMKGGAHAAAMDEIYDEAMSVARKLVDMGMNIDPARAPRMFEVANQFLKTAQDSKISERDAQLKLMKIILDQKKLELEAKRVNAELGTGESIKADIVVFEDRNKLLKMMRESQSSPDK